MRRIRLLFFMTCMLVSVFAFAQEVRVTGVITDKMTGEVLPGVSILIKGTTVGTVTNFDGEFTLSVPSDGVLMSSFIGYKPIEVSVQGKSKIDIQLEQDLISLDEIVAVGYGVVKKTDVTGSVSSVSSDKLLQAPISSLDAGIQGKIAGVSVQQTTGAPGQKMKIRVRGGSSINYDNSPLYVIDGFIGADITTINPGDIATIDILKDASATAVYGSRGANGVVLITTNKPTTGEMVISIDANYAVSTMVKEYEILSAGDQAELLNLQSTTKQYDAAKKNNIDLDPSSLVIPFTDDEVSYFQKNGGTDWMDLITRNGAKHNVSLNLSGGNDKLSYYLSASNMKDEGVLNETFYERTSIRSNIRAKLTDRIDMVFNTFGTMVDSQGNSRVPNTISRAILYPQFWESRDENGEFIDPTTYPSYSVYRPGSESNPEQFIQQNQESNAEKITSNIDLTIDLGHNFTLSINNAGSFGTSYSGQRSLIDEVNTKRDDVTAEQNYGRSKSFMNTDILTYDNQFGKHNLKVSAVYEYSESSGQSAQTKVDQLSTLANEWYILNNGTPSVSGSAYSESQMRSYMGRMNYSYNDRYLVTASMRADGTSLFSKENRWGYFPSAAFAWRASEETFIKDINWIYNFKVRAGFGSTGNTAISPYGTLSTLDFEDDDNIWYVFDGQTPESGVIPAKLTDPDLKWETTTQYNLGLDMAILEGKVSAVVDIYKKVSSDVIIEKTIPLYTGLPSLSGNFAEIENQGIEVALDWQIINGNDFNWSANFNYSKNINEVTDLGGSESIFIANEDDLNIWNIIGGNKFIVQKGEAMGSLYGIKSLGLWQADQAEEAAVYESYPGEVRYEDLNNDGAISGEDRQIIGNTQPDFTYGIGTNISYKNLDVAMQFVGSKGNDMYNYSRYQLDYNILNIDYLDRWSESNSDSQQKIMPRGTEHSATMVASDYVEDASFFKLANLTIGYNLPKSFSERLGVTSLRIYGSGTNLFTLTDYRGLDPEASSASITSDSQAGIDNFAYPIVRTFTGGVKIVF